MALHIQELCAVENITVSYQSLTETVARYSAIPSRRHITIRPTKNTGYYVSALHEIGHILGDNQSRNNTTKEKEIGAWIWAMLSAIVWTEIRRIESWLKHYGHMVLNKLKSRQSNKDGILATETRSKTLLNPKLIKLHIQRATPYRSGFMDKIVRLLDKIKEW